MSLTWQQALWDEGTDVMYEVTVQLYPGNISPQNILKKDYCQVFNSYQRTILESWTDSGIFDISSLAKNFDISLHFAVQKHVCKVWKHESLFNNVKNLVALRNKAAHHVNAYRPISVDDNEELDDLLQLCIDILEDLEDCTNTLQIEKKHKIQNSIERRKIRNSVNQVGSFQLNENYGQAYFSKRSGASTQKEESSGMSDLSKMAMGVGLAAAVGVGIGALIHSFSGEKKKK